MSEAFALVARGLHKRFVVKGKAAPTQALQDVSLAVPAGTLTAFVGPDGAGKTTMLRLAAGLMRADEGSLEVLGIDVAAHAQAVQDRISYMPQRFGLYEDLSVQENLDLYADLHGVPAAMRRERYARLLEMTDLGRFTARPAGKLSGGMKQKLGLACTLVRSPQLLLLDEPLGALDALTRIEMHRLIESLWQRHRFTALLVTHDVQEAVALADRVILIEDGRIALDEPVNLARPRSQGDPAFAALEKRILDRVLQKPDAAPVDGAPWLQPAAHALRWAV